MPLIVAIEPDRQQASKLAALARGPLRAELILADSTERAFTTLANRVPDLILTSLLLSPKDEAALADRLRDLDSSGVRVQTLVIPVLSSSPRRSTGGKTGLLNKLRRSSRRGSAPDGCDPAVFAEQIDEYLKRAADERARLEELDASRRTNQTIAAPIAAAPATQALEDADAPLSVEEEFSDPTDRAANAADGRLLLPEKTYENHIADAGADADIVVDEADRLGAMGEADRPEALSRREEPFFDHLQAAQEAPQVFEDSHLPLGLPPYDEVQEPHEISAREDETLHLDEVLAPQPESFEQAHEIAAPATNDTVAEPDGAISDDVVTIEPIDLEAFVRDLEAATKPADSLLALVQEQPEPPLASSPSEELPDSGLVRHAPPPRLEETLPDHAALHATDLDEDIAAFLDALPKLQGVPQRERSDAPSANVDRVADSGPRMPTDGRRRKRKPSAPPLSDDWRFFDPERCGFSALLSKLDELTEEAGSSK